MHKVQFDNPPNISNPEKYDPSLVKFISSCLVKDVTLR